jgi:hypothetical protein
VETLNFANANGLSGNVFAQRGLTAATKSAPPPP